MNLETPKNAARGPGALVIDWGGVLTPALDVALRQWALRDGVDFGHFREVLRTWLESGDPPTHHLERGTLAERDFERLLAAEPVPGAVSSTRAACSPGCWPTWPCWSPA